MALLAVVSRVRAAAAHGARGARAQRAMGGGLSRRVATFAASGSFRPDSPTLYSDADADDRSFLASKTALVTGPTSGLGAALVRSWATLPQAQRPRRCVLVARNADKARETASALEAAGIEAATYICDLSAPVEVLRTAKEIAAAEPVLDICCLNAGAWLVDPAPVLDADGLEAHYRLNFLHMVCFVQELTPLLARSAKASGGESRICVHGSYTGMYFSKGELDIDNLKTSDPARYKLAGNIEGSFPYSQTKLAQHVWCKAMVGKLPEGVTINVACPGSVPDTSLPAWATFKQLSGFLWPVLQFMTGARSSDEGVQPLAHLCGAAAMTGVSGTFLDWGHNTKQLQKNEPAPLEQYPTQRKAAPTTSDDAAVERLFAETSAVIDELRAHHGLESAPAIEESARATEPAAAA